MFSIRNGAIGGEVYRGDGHSREFFRACAKGHRTTRGDGGDRLEAACHLYRNGILMGLRMWRRGRRGDGSSLRPGCI